MKNLEQIEGLVRPSLAYKDSFLEAVKEGVSESFYKELDILDVQQNFAKYVKYLSDKAEGINLREGYVPASTFWFIKNGKFIGRIDIRHKLNEKLLKEGGHIGYGIRPSERSKGYGNKILKLGLEEAKKIGIKKALITCDDDNEPSIRIIENNGGVLENKIKIEGKLKRRYWIEIK